MQRRIEEPANPHHNYRISLKNIGSNIKHVREYYQISQVELAEACRMEKASLSRIEAGKINITLLTLCKIANALDFHMDELLFDIDRVRKPRPKRCVV